MKRIQAIYDDILEQLLNGEIDLTYDDPYTLEQYCGHMLDLLVYDFVYEDHENKRWRLNPALNNAAELKVFFQHREALGQLETWIDEAR